MVFTVLTTISIPFSFLNIELAIPLTNLAAIFVNQITSAGKNQKIIVIPNNTFIVQHHDAP